MRTVFLDLFLIVGSFCIGFSLGMMALKILLKKLDPEERIWELNEIILYIGIILFIISLIIGIGGIKH
jgi:hypothetical protein